MEKVPTSWEAPDPALPVPDPPHPAILSVIDRHGCELHRGIPDGTLWNGPFGAESWEHVLHYRGPITAGQLALKRGWSPSGIKED